MPSAAGVADYVALGPGSARVPLEDRLSWRVAHSLCFATGGLTFIAGTACLYAPATPAWAWASAVLYILGSLGFLAVDLLELAALGAVCAARANVALSASGSLLYVLGSIGFLPPVAAATATAAGALALPSLGVYAFLAGSAAIAASQAVKVARIVAGGGCRGHADIAADFGDGVALAAASSGWAADALTALGVEASAGAGAALFLLGTAWMDAGRPAAPVLAAWMAGSAAFTLGAALLAGRHFVLGIA